MGGSENKIRGEFRSNGHNNTIKHERGVISMARAYDKNSASSQFFIMHADAPHLDGEYAAFGKVVSGIEAVDEIASIPTDYNDRPKVAIRIKRAYIA
jgi:peptidyl-prolyl cis-trans isomerase B (cyclophilin B)